MERRDPSLRDRPSSIGLALYPYLLNTKDSGVFLVGCCTWDWMCTTDNENVGLSPMILPPINARPKVPTAETQGVVASFSLLYTGGNSWKRYVSQIAPGLRTKIRCRVPFWQTMMLLDCNFDFQKEDFGLLSDDNFSFFYEKVNRFCQKERLCCVVDFNKKIILQNNFPKKIIARWEETNQRGR